MRPRISIRESFHRCVRLSVCPLPFKKNPQKNGDLGMEHLRDASYYRACYLPLATFFISFSPPPFSFFLFTFFSLFLFSLSPINRFSISPHFLDPTPFPSSLSNFNECWHLGSHFGPFGSIWVHFCRRAIAFSRF